ncbi:MAG: hypothetical protein Greene041619_1096 [Candidatus Peregrinibacteria bacterium Greene0416_19]|nr:MAG: hypothetical protein Greene041619_1096 [Candidatus Peregrinibacteria bacterium Greene0416_19]
MIISRLRALVVSLSLLALFAPVAALARERAPLPVQVSSRRLAPGQAKRYQSRKDRSSYLKLRDEYSMRNDRRRNEVRSLVNAIFSYRLDNNYDLPPGIPDHDDPREICRPDAVSKTSCVDLTSAFDPYMEKIPVDPLAPADQNGTGYVIYLQLNGRGKVTVEAKYTEELLAVIKQSR